MSSHKQMTPILGHSWSQTSRPGANVQATATQAAPGANYQLVCTGITVILSAGSANPSAATVNVSLIDGVSGGTTYLWGAVLGVPATAGLTAGIARMGLWIASANGPMTLEFSTAGGANTIESISFEGFVQRSY